MNRELHAPLDGVEVVADTPILVPGDMEGQDDAGTEAAKVCTGRAVTSPVVPGS